MFKFFLPRSIFLSPDPAEGAPPSTGAPPPAAAVVDKSDATEKDAAEIVELRRKHQEAETGRKKAETRAAELEDENRRLKAIPKEEVPPAKTPAAKKSWLDAAAEWIP